jgi:gluconate 2-dehydrogenase gamma chain
MSGQGGSDKEATGGLSRAQLIRRAGTLSAAAALPSVAGGATAATAVAAGATAADDALKALTPTEAATLEAVLERLLPSGVAGPGAKEANVLRYIDWSLAGDLSAFHPPYSAALVAIDAFSAQVYGATFAALAPAQQDALLTRMAAGAEKAVTGTAPQPAFLGFSPSSAAVFTMVRTHALQGMFGDPMHGGNVDQVGWKLMRFPGPRLVISKHDQELDVVPKAQYLKSTYTYKLFKNTTRRP